jgi:superfamily I DNA/RNA helicase
MLDMPGVTLRAWQLLTDGRVSSPCTAVIVDEVQDLRPPDIRFVGALCAAHPGNLMVCGDAGQRSYAGDFSLDALGIDVGGRATVLRINYRTTEQIRRLADQVRASAVDDMNGGKEDGRGARSLRPGLVPELRGYRDQPAELAAAVARVRAWLGRGMQASAIAVLAPSHASVTALRRMLSDARIPWRRIDDREPMTAEATWVDTMRFAKGLEFKAVLLLDCGVGMIPDPSAVAAADPEDREGVIERERNLLYVAMTRARDELVVSWSGKPSPFM